MYYILGELSQKSKNQQRYGDLFYIYIGVVVGSSIIIPINYILNFYLYHSTAKNLHNSMVWKLLRAPMSFYDSNSIGTILTRFTKDIESLDNFMPNFSFVTLRYTTQILASMIAIIIAVPFMIIILVIFVIIVWAVRRFTTFTLQNLE